MPQGSGTGFGNLLFLALPILLLVWMYTSQRKRTKVMAQMQSALTVGEEVVTTSGLYGRIVELGDRTVTLEVSPGVQMRFDRRAIAMPAAKPAGAEGDQ